MTAQLGTKAFLVALTVVCVCAANFGCDRASFGARQRPNVHDKGRSSGDDGVVASSADDASGTQATPQGAGGSVSQPVSDSRVDEALAGQGRSGQTAATVQSGDVTNSAISASGTCPSASWAWQPLEEVESQPPATGGVDWEQYDFMIGEPSLLTCTGDKYVRWNATYKKWVGVVLCSAEKYNILLGPSQGGEFFLTADGHGHGLDHCELIDASILLGDSDESLASSVCPDCSITGVLVPTGKKIFARDRSGEKFCFGINPSNWGYLTNYGLSCGVRVP